MSGSIIDHVYQWQPGTPLLTGIPRIIFPMEKPARPANDPLAGAARFSFSIARRGI